MKNSSDPLLFQLPGLSIHVVEITKTNSSSPHLNSIASTSIQVKEESFLENEVSYMPNPTEGTVKIELPKICEQVEIEVFNLFGKKVLQKEFFSTESFELDLPGPAGLYFVKLSGLQKSVTLTIQKKN